MNLNEQAWITFYFHVRQVPQKQLAAAIGHRSPASISNGIRRFCDHYGHSVWGVNWDEGRRRCAVEALHDHFEAGGKITHPEPWLRTTRQSTPHELKQAWNEHAFLLRCEGLTYRKIGEHLGVSSTRAMGRTMQFSRTMAHVMRKTHFHWQEN
jgi:hypothetical protein